MAFDKRQSRKITNNVKYEDAPGIRMDAGMHIGIVKHVVDSTRTGRLIVYLPNLGGDPDNIHNQRIVQYASPFFGYTNLQENPGTGKPNLKNEFETVRHTYGMWMNPPDVGVKVLVMFETGDANSGYWFACLPPSVEHNMAGTSGGAAKAELDKDPQVDPLIKGYSTNFAPACEYNAADITAFSAGVLTNKKPPHRIQTKILAEQGTLADPVRGVDDASSIRETPSGIFGITTPGRQYIDQVTDDLLQRTKETPTADVTKLKEKVEYGRKGGHQFTMDDGDVNGEQRRIKLRSAAGHQIIMDDTEGMIYISNSTGTSWIELTNDGQMYIYAENDITVRTGGDLSTKVDGDYYMEVDGDYELNVKGDMKTETANREEIVKGTKDQLITGHLHQVVQDGKAVDVTGEWGLTISGTGAIQSGGTSGWLAGGALNFEAPTINLNSGAPPSPLTAIAPELFELTAINDTVKIGDIWKHESPSDATGATILLKIPTHEPYDSREVKPLISKTGQPSKKV